MLQQLYYFVVSLFLANCILGKDKPIALIGTILLPDQSITNGTLLIIGRHIVAVGVRVSIPDNAIILHTNGLILPGLIDLHNHLTWNILPRWKPTEEFGSRYDWQKKPIYRTLIQAPHQGLIEAGLSCEMQRYAEVKAITQGATSVIGSLRRVCNRGLARNLDDDPTLGKILYNVFPLQMTDIQLKAANEVLSSNGTLLIHLAEGSPNDATAAIEFPILKARNLLRPGVSLIHCVALKENDFREMANAGVGFVWAPRSNLELYGDTADLEAALKNHVVIAIAPDWSPTGSDGLLGELNYASTWNVGLQYSLIDDRLLLHMATINPAKLVHLEKRLGSLKEGFLADVLVLQINGNQSEFNPYWIATHSVPEDVSLVVIDGKAVYGNPQLMKQLVDSSKLESLDICGVEKSISFASQPNPQPSFQHTQKLLSNTLRRWGRTLAPLSECGK